MQQVRLPSLRDRPVLYVLAAFVLGVILTLIGSLFPIRTLLGATHYGIPFAWRYRLVLAPQYNPWRINWGMAALDVVFWTIVSFAAFIVFIASRHEE